MAKTLEEHAGYLTDKVKLERYQAAISRVVCDGQRVMDLGCGSGILGLMALRAGASEVIFVEEDGVIEIARRSIEEAGYSDQSTFVRANSFQTEATNAVDAVVCDHVGYFGFDYGLLGLLADAKQRFLKPGGIIIPGRLQIQLSLVESQECRQLIAKWQGGSVPGDYQWVDSLAANTKHAVDLVDDDLLAGPTELADMALGEEANEFMSWTTEFTSDRNGLVDGLAGSFRALLVDDIEMTNSPSDHDRLNRPQAFLPLRKPIKVSAGEKVVVTIMCRHIDHVIGWVVDFPQQDLKYSHNTFNGLLLDDARLAQSQPDRKAMLNARGLARKTVLSYCDGKRTVGEIQSLVRVEHPNLFPTRQATTAFVDQVLDWDTED